MGEVDTWSCLDFLRRSVCGHLLTDVFDREAHSVNCQEAETQNLTGRYHPCLTRDSSEHEEVEPRTKAHRTNEPPLPFNARQALCRVFLSLSAVTRHIRVGYDSVC